MLAACGGASDPDSTPFRNDDPPVTSPGNDGATTSTTQTHGGSGLDETSDDEPPDQDADVTYSGLTDAELEAIIEEAEQSPLTESERVSMDGIATDLLVSELVDAGVDLTGMGVFVFAVAGDESFVTLETNDDTALIVNAQNDDTTADDLLLTLVESAAVEQFGVEWMVLEHSGTDDQGPYVLSIMIDFDDLSAAAYDGADLSEHIAAQVARG